MYVDPVILSDHLRNDKMNHVACSRCLAPMVRVLYFDLVRARRWFFWRCSNNPQHFTCVLPLPDTFSTADPVDKLLP